MTNRTTFNVMARLIKLIKPLSAVMAIAILTGCLGFFCASFISVLGGYTVLEILKNNTENLHIMFIVVAVIAIMRGVLHYIEQYCNHFIAFRLLALIRDKVFTALRRLAPAKLDSADRGNLVSIITSDTELLEVFYAHTVSPICIAVITSVTVIGFISTFHIGLGVVAAISHIAVGVLVPVIISKNSKQSGERHRKEAGNLNSYFLDCLRGTREIIQYDNASERSKKIAELTEHMEKSNREIKGYVGKTTALTHSFILASSAVMLFVSASMHINGIIGFESVVIPTMMLFASFGAVTATANLGAGLSQTIASGNRVLDILDAKPIIEEVADGVDVEFRQASLNNITFSYENNEILKDFSLEVKNNIILGITGKSGSGKSTILKLLMRFWDVQKGSVCISTTDVKAINTKSLRQTLSYATQDTHLFNDTVENNLKIANLNADREQLIDAAKKASIHEFIETLPNGYETQVGELGDTLSGGERQRLGIARAFLHEAPLILLDEPTSNLDSLNEGVILKSLKDNVGKTVVLVSHRQSTMRIADEVVHVDSGRLS